MEFLEKNKIVHGDLATRNILLHKHKTVAKVSDFGLSRSLYSSVEDLASVSSGLPVRWMAPEVLMTRMVNNKSDVWSFGVLVWEMFSLGTVPYPTISHIDMKFIHVRHSTAHNLPMYVSTPQDLNDGKRTLGDFLYKLAPGMEGLNQVKDKALHLNQESRFVLFHNLYILCMI